MSTDQSTRDGSRAKATVTRPLMRFGANGRAGRSDVLAVEEPLEVLLRRDGRELPWLITMRTPGRDRDLVAGLLYSEGIVTGWEQIRRIVVGCGRTVHPDDVAANRVLVELEPDAAERLTRSGRAVVMSSACGVCGRRVLDAIEAEDLPDLSAGPVVAADLVTRLPELLRAAQANYRRTGGTHAAGWFDGRGELLRSAEDVARHNAVDKTIGAGLLARTLPAGEAILVVSGRLSWEILHKARRAGFPFVVGIGAPSSLAVALAARFGMTLCGFVRDGGFNVYSGLDRIAESGGRRDDD